LDGFVHALVQVDAGVPANECVVVGAGVLIGVQAQVNATNGNADPVEAEQVDLHEVVHLQPGNRIDALAQQVHSGVLTTSLLDDRI